MGICMLLIGLVFNCFLWLVCDFSGKLGKNVCFDMYGEYIELDKMVLEKIGDLLVYLVCNVIDYGLEMFDKCCVVGKVE